MYSNTLKVFKMCQIGQQRKVGTLQTSFQSHEMWGLKMSDETSVNFQAGAFQGQMGAQ